MKKLLFCGKFSDCLSDNFLIYKRCSLACAKDFLIQKIYNKK
jgi:hypothetical protein